MNAIVHVAVIDGLQSLPNDAFGSGHWHPEKKKKIRKNCENSYLSTRLPIQNPLTYVPKLKALKLQVLHPFSNCLAQIICICLGHS